jgi:hypothetical protein
MTYEIGKFRGHTLWMWGKDIPDDDMDEDMYVNRHDYSVWYKGRQLGYMKSDRSCVEPFNDRLYNDLKNLKTFTPPKKKVEKEEKPVEKKKKVAPKKVEEAIPADDLISLTLGSVQTFGDEVFAELKNSLDKMMEGMKEWI